MALFSEFLCDRLKDHYTIIPHALFGILSLVGNFRITVCFSMLMCDLHIQVDWAVTSTFRNQYHICLNLLSGRFLKSSWQLTFFTMASTTTRILPFFSMLIRIIVHCSPVGLRHLIHLKKENKMNSGRCSPMMPS